jgi:hypothetical protein
MVYIYSQKSKVYIRIDKCKKMHVYLHLIAVAWCDKWHLYHCTTVSASSPLVGFGELNDNIIKDLTSLRSVEQEIEFVA